ncbi:outer membrane protein [Altererythrobacter atlanticus]|uniref:Outer membrane protein W n=1 Tax=Croceibacterium atlanticum TaxID=1267766 RepID=A0A0F7KR61_9SPHN|nr:OmpW family outer membrane protein [Croceibacterium atlanticum]AKH42089.1 Outer membrane protein W precursor [Croceibacterium atlanticum]MBB5733342.1 outer membrane protein [Croceibacterium atlanticum]
MRKAIALAAIAAATCLTSPALAQDGKVQVKVLATAVLPDGEIDKVKIDEIGLPSTLQTEANDNVVPTVAIEYFFTPEISLETICCVTQHDVDATAGVPGAELVSDAKLIPATFTLKYHLNAGGISPYIGAGPAYFIWVDEKPGAAAVDLGADRLKMSDELGLALQAGIDVPVNDSFIVSLDAKRYFIGTTATWYAAGTKVIETDHNVDPWVLSAGVGFRF